MSSLPEILKTKQNAFEASFQFSTDHIQFLENICCSWNPSLRIRFLIRVAGDIVAVKIMESLHEVVEEIEEEYQILRDLSSHPNLPKFHGVYLKQDPQTEDQFWIAMEVCNLFILRRMKGKRLTLLAQGSDWSSRGKREGLSN